MKVISILNLKGGVAKTFTASNMAYELYRRGYKVLLLDNDKQGNLSKAYGKYDKNTTSPVAELLRGKPVENMIQHTAYEGIDIITANMSIMSAVQFLSNDADNQLFRYRKIFDMENDYDYCIIDNPPDIGLNVVNALMISNEVIVPVKIDEWALEGLEVLDEQIKVVKHFNPDIKFGGMLVTVYQKSDGEAAGLDWLKRIKEYKVLGKIRYSKKVAESTFLFKPIYEYSPCCGAAQDYKRFVAEYTGKSR